MEQLVTEISTQLLNKKYRVWFNTCSIDENDDMWMSNYATSYTIEEINDIRRHHTVTHVILEGDIPPDISTLFPHLTHLRLYNVDSNTDCTSICSLRSLAVLDISENNLSESLPDDIFASLLSLRELDMRGCKLVTLPNSICSLKSLEVLDISENNLFEGLPDNIFTSLLSLRELHMQCCKLSALLQSISSLKNLEVMDISMTNLSEGLPDDIFTSLLSLRELYMRDCELSTLPNSMHCLQKLQKLDISRNNLTSIPSPVCTLSRLRKLDISKNNFLTSLDNKILQLTQLHELKAHGCNALTSPPIEVCKRGITAVRQYYTDLAKGAGKSLPFATIAMLGNTMAGKTSLIKTLQSTDRKRVLTNRGSDAEKDETTMVFNVEEFEVDGTALRLIDFGGQEVYHITYQLTLRQNCIPVIVVNMEQYNEVSNTSTPREAVRRLAFDYMSHLYLANPTLDAPKLIFTHKDKFQSIQFQELKKSFLDISNQLCEDLVGEEKGLDGDFARILHFSKSTEVFLNGYIYEVGKDDKYEVFDLIKNSLLQSSQHFVKPLPSVWEEVNEKVLSLPSVYSTFDEILRDVQTESHHIESGQLDTILTYMHDCGKVLWYKNISSLSPYIFHKISEVTKLLCVLYHHDPNIWQRRADKFQPYYSKNKLRVEKQDFEELVSQFTHTGLMMECLLFYLIEKETSFTKLEDVEVAVCLLQTFRLLHGYLNEECTNRCFIVPQFAQNFYNISFSSPKVMLLHVETQFNGLALPQYVYHQMTVGLLEMFPLDFAKIEVKRNGANVYQDGIYTQLVHDYKTRKVLLYVSSNAANISRMWKRLIKTNNNILRHVLETWTASRPVTTCYCAHCLLLRLPCPKKVCSPQWCLRSTEKPLQDIRMCSALSTTLCNSDEIPTALVYPCNALLDTETDKFETTILEMKLRGEQQESCNTSVASCSQSNSMTTTMTANDDISDLSDEDDNLYPDKEEVKEMKLIRLRLNPTSNPKLRQLFSNTDKVFNMTRKRGRALIINNKNFDERPDLCRKGSDVDFENMYAMLKEFKFDVVPHTDLTAQEMLSVVKSEVKKEEHKNLGCHVLVIMTHGGLNNHIYGKDLKRVKLTDVYDLLTPLNFTGMAGKPKVVILEACSGERSDFGDRGIGRFDIGDSQTEEIESISPPLAKFQRLEDAEAMNRLNYDDLLVVKSSMESFISKRHPEYGSLMIRALVSSMYKHAGHHDLYTIFKQVQTKVRKLCVDRNFESGGQLVVIWDTLTHMRKLYLFPGFNGYKGGDDS